MGSGSPSFTLRISATSVGLKSRHGRDVAEVVVVLVRAGDQVRAAFERRDRGHHGERRVFAQACGAAAEADGPR